MSDFPRLAGETGDAARIQRAAEAAGKGGVVWFPRGVYEVDSTLLFTNHTSLLLHQSARLRATRPMEYMVIYDGGETKGTRGAGDLNLFIRGGFFDGAGLAGCMNIRPRRHLTIADASFLNGKGVGLRLGDRNAKNGCEFFAYNLYFACEMPGLAGNVAFETYIGDSHFTDLVCVDYTVGIRDYKWSNRYTRCHVWGGCVKKPGTTVCEYLENSIAFDLRGDDTVLDDCYADTSEIGFNICKDSRLYNCAYFNNYAAFKMDNPQIIVHNGGLLLVTGGRFTKNSPHAVMYVRGKYAGRLIWRDNLPLNFTNDEMKALNDELKKQGASDKAEKNNAQLAG